MTSYLKLKRWLRSKGVDAAVLDGCFGLASLQEMLPGLGDQLSFSWWNMFWPVVCCPRGAISDERFCCSDVA